MNKKLKPLIWNLYEDQVQKINLEIIDGKSFSELIRRIIDESIMNEHHKYFNSFVDDVERPLKKVTIRVTKEQFKYLKTVFPRRSKSKGLRFLIDYYFNNKEVH